MKTLTTILFTLLLAFAPASASAAITPQIQWSASVPGATFLYYDAVDGVIWAAIPAQDELVAISPASHQVVATQPVGMQVGDCDVDVAFNNLWCIGAYEGSNVIAGFNMAISLENGFGNGSPTTYSGFLPKSGAPYSISVDAPDRVAFIASGGGLYKWSIRQPGILGTITPPDGYAVQNVLYSSFYCESDTALVLTTLGTNSSGYVVADWWFADLNAHSTCSTAWVPINYQTFTGENNLFQPFPVLRSEERRV